MSHLPVSRSRVPARRRHFHASLEQLARDRALDAVDQRVGGLARAAPTARRPQAGDDVSRLSSFGPCLSRNVPSTVSQIQPE